MTYTEETAAQCASIGAQLLDQYDPNWPSHIDILDLNMARQCNCIMGQLYVHDDMTYSLAMVQRFRDPKWAHIVEDLIDEHHDLFEMLHDGEDQWPDKFLGFDVPYIEAEVATNDLSEQDRRYGWLKAAWLAEIAQR